MSSTAVNGSGFVTSIFQFGAWGSFAIWVGLSVFSLLKLISNHQMNNMKVSMYLERQRLMNEDVFRDDRAEGTSTPPALEM